MELLDKMVLGEGNIKVYDARLIIADNYNVTVDKVNEVISNTLSTEFDKSANKPMYIRICTQTEYDSLTPIIYPQYNNTMFFIIS